MQPADEIVTPATERIREHAARRVFPNSTVLGRQCAERYSRASSRSTDQILIGGLGHGNTVT
jgi:hypothetical protein